jgi:hypothetical protein
VTEDRVKKYSALFGLLLGWLVSADAQTFHVQPANPVLVGEPMSITLDGLPVDQDVTLVAEHTMEASKLTSWPLSKCENSSIGNGGADLP